MYNSDINITEIFVNKKFHNNWNKKQKNANIYDNYNDNTFKILKEQLIKDIIINNASIDKTINCSNFIVPITINNFLLQSHQTYILINICTQKSINLIDHQMNIVSLFTIKNNIYVTMNYTNPSLNIIIFNAKIKTAIAQYINNNTYYSNLPKNLQFFSGINYIFKLNDKNFKIGLYNTINFAGTYTTSMKYIMNNIKYNNIGIELKNNIDEIIIISYNLFRKYTNPNISKINNTNVDNLMSLTNIFTKTKYNIIDDILIFLVQKDVHVEITHVTNIQKFNYKINICLTINDNNTDYNKNYNIFEIIKQPKTLLNFINTLDFTNDIIPKFKNQFKQNNNNINRKLFTDMLNSKKISLVDLFYIDLFRSMRCLNKNGNIIQNLLSQFKNIKSGDDSEIITLYIQNNSELNNLIKTIII